ncbi:MAG: lipo-like protein [Proteobacteria bacterium]|nr:lipo-like protein [Pseudomonadota bacterium]
MLRSLGRRLAHYLNQPIQRYEPFAVVSVDCLSSVLQPADVLLVEGKRRVSTAIKYLTQSTWSHAALFVGDFSRTGLGLEAPALIEADVEQGVVAVPLSRYAGHNVRVCRPASLTEADALRVCRYATDRIGHEYDLKNIIDLARYLLPVPPVPVYWRRRLLALGSGSPTRAICSTLIAQAFQSVRYPILPRIQPAGGSHLTQGAREVLHVRHYSLFTPRDFDISPYFQVLKPEVECGFDYHALLWGQEVAAGSGPPENSLSCEV